MIEGDKRSQEARARALRKQIDEVAGRPSQDEASPRDKPEKPEAESPRDFIQRRMRELDQKDRGK